MGMTSPFGAGAQNARARNAPQLSVADERRHRVKVALAWVAVALSTVMLAVYLITAIHWHNRPFMGMLVSPTLVVTQAQSTTNTPWNGLVAGVRPTDRVIAINGEPLDFDPQNPFAARATYDRVIDSLAVGDTVTLSVLRTNGTIDEFTFETQSSPPGEFLIYFMVPFVTGAIVLFFAYLILITRPAANGALMVVLVNALLAMLLGGIFDSGTSQHYVLLYIPVVTLLGGVTVVFSMVFPSKLGFLYRNSIALIVPLVVAVLVAMYALINYVQPPNPFGFTVSIQIAFATTVAGMIFLLGFMYMQRRSAVSLLTRDQSGLMLFGTLLAFAPGVIWVMGLVMQAINPQYRLPFGLEAALPFLLAPVIATTYAVLQERHIDTDRLLSQSITYVILLFTLAIAYFLLVMGASLFFTGILPNNPLLIALTLFFVSVLFVPVRGRLQSHIDRIFFRQRRDLQSRLEEFSEQLGSLNTIPEIIEEFRALTRDAISPSSIFVYQPKVQGDEFVAFGLTKPETDIIFQPDSGLVTYLRTEMPVFFLQPNVPLPKALLTDRGRLGVLKPVVVSALNGKEGLNGFVMIGAPKRGNAQYDYEELRFLNAMINQLSVALERAQVIDSLQRSVGELNVLSQVSQAMNFTIEFDDLLELIYAQTVRLINASHFYIALYDRSNTQMYFAFYLEDDERYDRYENVRWQLGDDIYSHIVRSGQNIRIDNYSGLIEQGAYTSIFQTDTQIKMLMAVPLIAQTSTLGVLAVGRTGGEPFNAQQAKIFSNIATLAASSLDRVRLFTEVNVRARQLAALNDISQKLVAAESEDIDALLSLITSSAVSILNGEAGSLLLVTDDNPDELEFKVVIGGTSGDLIGKRISANYGLVGEVVRTGKSQISNDIRRDERWEGEVTSSGFRTNSILAVPLVAKDNIIGVLEVLNKRDGTVFLKEDEELLTTLGGQAAIAIENARLFQMTGSQLNQRVQELETLERIDRELARELDLIRVAQITIKWALNRSGATAGALGEVDENAGVLRIRAHSGYPEGVLPKEWPLDRGIVRRVMRTRLPDLADVKIDPDYVQTLASANSQITVPMMAGKDINAILIVEKDSEPRLNLLDLEFVKRLAERASIALANAQLYEEVKQAAETKSEFVGFAAHELKNPLTSIKGYAMLFDMMNGPQRDEALRVIRTNADRMQSIIDDMRDIAKSDAGKLQLTIDSLRPFDVVRDSMMPYMKQIEEKRQTVYNNVSEDLPMIRGDLQKLIQVMVNLISNAYKYSPEGASITLDARAITNYRDERGKQLGNMVEFAVTDTGIGMSEQDLKRIFREDYFRSENRLAQEQKGTGLGMIITERIVLLHGGRIWVESTLGVGTTFRFVVPQAAIEQKEDSTDHGARRTQVREAVKVEPGDKDSSIEEKNAEPASD